MEITLKYSFYETIYTSNPDQVLFSPYYACYNGEIFVNSGAIETEAERDSEKAPTMLCAGKFSFVLVDVEKMEKEKADLLESTVAVPRVFDMLDDLFRDKSYEFKSRMNKLSSGVSSKNILMLDKLEIYPRFRKRMIGIHVTKMIIQRFSSFAGLVIADLRPLQFDSVCTEKELNTMEYERMTTNKVVANRALVKYFSPIEFGKIPHVQFYGLKTQIENRNVKKLNPFKTAQARKEYENMVEMYCSRHQNLFHGNGMRNKSNAVGEMFWRGYDGIGANMWDSDSKKMIAYIHWRAGQDMAISKE